MSEFDNDFLLKPRHSSLTKYIRRDGRFSSRRLAAVLERCDVSPDVGALPPALRDMVPMNDIRDVTQRFRVVLANLLIQMRDVLRNLDNCGQYELDEIAQIFNTPCVLTCNNSATNGNVPWRGLSGFVYKMSFPKIGAEYALKDFKVMSNKVPGHGCGYEIPAAFAAARAEAPQNTPIYMASFGAAKYMLSKWMGDECDNALPRRNTYEIFTTHPEEIRGRNYRMGHRIDFGRTYLTAYGAATSRVRKNYRKIVNVLSRANPELIVPDELVQLLGADYRGDQRRDMDRALELVKMTCPMYMLRLLMKYERGGRD